MSPKTILFLLPNKTLNEATLFYVKICQDAFINRGYQVVESSNLMTVTNYRNVFVMSAKWCFLVKLLNPTANVITWFQGLGGEEALLSRNSRRDKAIWSMLELFAVRKSFLAIYVSERMKDYYELRYKTKNQKYFIMPCFNKKLNLEAFNYPNKYTTPSFVYAGSLDKWQCIEETLLTYKKIESKLPNAHITILTKDSERANLLLKKFKIRNGSTKFVSLENLDDELRKYKYGFLIRKNHIVNNVSTPTKMNSYLANGIIPIYTDVINSFNRNLNINKFILLDHTLSIEDWADQIISFEKAQPIRIESLKSSVVTIFQEYYSTSHYIEELSMSLE